ncbi:MAG TPA: sulfatase-like hydrolase/transferase [Pirellulaceae bacterium]|nr:sulfatase-like hydrolase/transferase [Pirellulaceae bacterium]
MILADDLGYADISSFGSTDLKTPHVDRLAAEGMKLTRFYANCCVCSPTRASLLSGRYPELVGVPGVIRTHSENNWGRLHPNALLLPAALKRAGYRTGIVGKWHLGLEAPDRPTDRGFDEFHGFLGDMMDDYFDHRRHDVNYMRDGERTIDPEGHATDLFGQWACDLLDEWAQEEQPFFLYLAFNAPHTPIQPPDDWLAKVRVRESGISDRRAKLVALIEHMDRNIGRVLDRLDELGIADETLVVFTSDNGGDVGPGANNGPWRAGKGTMYEGGLLVPTIVRWPSRIEPGSESSAACITMDLFPTLCEAAGVPVEREIDGRSLMPLLTGEADDLPARDLFFVRREGGGEFWGQDARAVRRWPYKLAQNRPFESYQLYDLSQDPQEAKNLAADMPAKVRELAVALSQQIQRGGAVPWQTDASESAAP